MSAPQIATVLTLTARFGGTWGNGYQLTEGVDAGGVYSVTTAMASGVGDISGPSGYIKSVLDLSQVNSEVIDDLNQLLESPV